MNIKKRFTKWYVKKGYKFGYDFTDVPVYDDGFMKTPAGVPKSVWHCPWWVKPLLIFFSPSVYFMSYGNMFMDGFLDGLKNEMEAKEDGNMD